MKEILLRGIKELGIEDKNENLLRLLLLYVKEIKMFNGVFNLVKFKNEEELAAAHILDSLSAYVFFNAEVQLLLKKTPKEINIADVGSGAGLPGIPLACLFYSFSETNASVYKQNQIRFTLIERMKKRSGFLQNVKAVLNLPNVHIFEDEVEKAPRNQFDIVTCRAFRTLDKNILSVLLRCVNENGKLFLYKAAAEKICKEAELIKNENLIFKIEKLKVPFLQRERNLVIVEKKA